MVRALNITSALTAYQLGLFDDLPDITETSVRDKITSIMDICHMCSALRCTGNREVYGDVGAAGEAETAQPQQLVGHREDSGFKDSFFTYLFFIFLSAHFHICMTI